MIFGDGPLRGDLTTMIERLGLADDVVLAGACTQQELLPVFRQADIFALTPFITDDGDRDGIPNVLVEAMACGLPVVSTKAAGIPELVMHNHNGLLTEPHDVAAITAEIATLLDDEPKRKRLGAAARRTAVEHFDLHLGAQELARLFDHVLARAS
jgi:glycosyltransferase involved in cell wall biosynthesis